MKFLARKKKKFKLIIVIFKATVVAAIITIYYKIEVAPPALKIMIIILLETHLHRLNKIILTFYSKLKMVIFLVRFFLGIKVTIYFLNSFMIGNTNVFVANIFVKKIFIIKKLMHLSKIKIAFKIKAVTVYLISAINKNHNRKIIVKIYFWDEIEEVTIIKKVSC